MTDHLKQRSPTDGRRSALLPIAYGAGYAALVLMLAVAVFERRDFR